MWRRGGRNRYDKSKWLSGIFGNMHRVAEESVRVQYTPKHRFKQCEE